MKLVAIVRPPPQPDAAASALAAATGLTLAEARMRLAPEPPALLARFPPDAAATLVRALRTAGLAALAVDVDVPTDRHRTLAHRMSIDPQALTVSPRFGEAVRLAWTDVRAILRGVRSSRLDVQRTEKTKRFSVGTAVMTGGLVMTRGSERTVRSSDETTEQVILVYARDGRAATLAEPELDFSCLGARMQPSSTANMVELARQLRERAPGAYYDERLVRLGRRALPFVVGGESRSQTSSMSVARTDTAATLDVLAEVLHRALLESLLP